MKAVFHNTPKRLQRIALACITRWDEDCHYTVETDSQGATETRRYPHINPDQGIVVEGSTITVQGQRCALWADAFGPLMEALHAAGLEPTEYVTSDRRLHWYETLDSYMQKRAPFEEVMKYIAGDASRQRVQEYASLAPLLAVARLMQSNPAKAYAAHTSEELAKARRLLPYSNAIDCNNVEGK